MYVLSFIYYFLFIKIRIFSGPGAKKCVFFGILLLRYAKKRVFFGIVYYFDYI